MPSVDLTPPRICDTMTLPPIPAVPNGVSFDIPLPGIGTVFSARLCCKVFQLPVGLPPIDLGITISLPLIVALDSLIDVINAYRSLLPMSCPRE